MIEMFSTLFYMVLLSTNVGAFNNYRDYIEKITYRKDNCIYLYSASNDRDSVIYKPPANWVISAFDWNESKNVLLVSIFRNDRKDPGKTILLEYDYEKRSRNILKEKEYSHGEGFYSISYVKYILNNRYAMIKEGYYEGQGIEIVDVLCKASLLSQRGIYIESCLGFSSDSTLLFGCRAFSELDYPMDGYDETEIYTFNIITSSFTRKGYGSLERPSLNIGDSILLFSKEDSVFFYKYPNKQLISSSRNRDRSYTRISSWNPIKPYILQEYWEGFCIYLPKEKRELLFKTKRTDHYFIDWTPHGDGIIYLEDRKILVRSLEKDTICDFGYFAEQDKHYWNYNLETLTAKNNGGKAVLINVGKETYKEIYLLYLDSSTKEKLPFQTDMFIVKWNSN